MLPGPEVLVVTHRINTRTNSNSSSCGDLVVPGLLLLNIATPDVCMTLRT